MRRFSLLPALMLFVGVMAGLGISSLVGPMASSPLAIAQQSNSLDIAAEIKSIQGKLPDQAHAMKDVGYHFANLWFAGDSGHWDLANFYLSETKSHLHWAVRIISKRKDTAGREIDLEAILQAFENTPLKQLNEAVVAKDKSAFVAAYRFTLESCYSCHKAADKPFLRPQIPTTPEAAVINFDPAAEWPN